jgi:hypothetical protein
MKKTLLIIQLFLVLQLYSQNQTVEETVLFLSQDSLNGRLVGTESERKSADYLEGIFKNLGLEPLFNNSYQTEFETEYNINPHSTSNTEVIKIKGRNVSAYLNNQASKTFVIGAHYDHIGRNEYNQSLSPELKNQIHNGADDNASGVAAVIELARSLTSNNKIENANYIFVCFSGEEIGLIGSKDFVKLLKSKQKVDLMINMDMIGRMDNINNLYVGGVGTTKVFGDILIKEKPNDFKLVIDSSGVGPSDHTSFYLDSIPVLFFYTGAHSDYHKPSDDFEKIKFDELKRIILYIGNVTSTLENEPSIPFKKSGSTSKTKSSFKVTLGILPNYSNSVNGLLIDAVTEGKTAMKAGLEAGDIIIKIGKFKIKDIYDYMECLSKLEKGDKITITVKRKESMIKKKVKLL